MRAGRAGAALGAVETPGGVRRPAAVVLGAIGAFLIGGVAQAVVWTWGIDWLTAVSNSQFLWALLCFLVAWAWASGRLLPGAAAGAVTGLALIVSYYVMQWAVSGREAAVSQFTEARGLAWTGACVLGGGAVGLLAALAGEPAAARPRRKAFGLTAAGTLIGAGPAAWQLALRGHFLTAGALAAVAVFLGTGLALLATALRSCGLRNTVLGGGPAVLAAAALLAGLFVLQASHFLYLTF